MAPRVNEAPGASGLAAFVAELRRRRVIRVAVVYAIAGWIVIEVAATVLPPMNLPDWSVKLVIVLIALGFPIAVSMGWMLDAQPHDRGDAVPTPPRDVRPANTAAADPAASTTATTPAPRRTNVVEDRRSIAVLPFVNMSGDAENLVHKRKVRAGAAAVRCSHRPRSQSVRGVLLLRLGLYFGGRL